MQWCPGRIRAGGVISTFSSSDGRPGREKNFLLPCDKDFVGLKAREGKEGESREEKTMYV